ncbi:hypothetical protein ACFW1A_21500 [Kitasatospora sp. NPDC058965]|uniref:hypothetical protein n=1 Tax=Kitasatospora sp. NPDC058965 TaxID=3346682 RepID=UPI0036C8056E
MATTVTTPLDSPTVVSTENGTLTFYTYTTVPSSTDRATMDAAAFIAQAVPTTPTARPGDPISDVISAVGVGAQIVGTVFQAGQFGLGIANTARAYQNPTTPNNPTSPTQVQQGVATIVLTNNALFPLGFSTVKATECVLTQAPTVLTTGQSGNVLLTRNVPLDGSSSVEVSLEIGDGDGGNILVVMTFNYSATDTVWTLQMSVDGSGFFTFPAAAALTGCTFAPNPNVQANFSIFFAPIQAASGSMQVMVYPYSGAGN